MVQYACLTGNGPPPSKRQGALRAIFKKNAIWSAGQVGRITITFGSYRCNGCDSTAAWSNIGSESNGARPSCNLGFIDPPFNNFKFGDITYTYDSFKTATRNYCDCDTSLVCCQGGGPNKIRPWTPGSTVIHEFCHALGMMHEHQNNLNSSNKIKLNPANVIAYYENNGMSSEEAKINVLDRYSCTDKDSCAYVGSDYDPDSIMLYALLDEWVQGSNPTYPNFVLSSTDKQWLGSRYPSTKEAPQLVVEFIDNNEPEWKKAWTVKTVIENLLPIVNIKMKFIDNSGKDITYTPIQSPRPLIPKRTFPYNIRLIPRPKEGFEELEPIYIVLIVITILIIIGIFTGVFAPKIKMIKIPKIKMH